MNTYEVFTRYYGKRRSFTVKADSPHYAVIEGKKAMHRSLKAAGQKVDFEYIRVDDWKEVR